VLEAAGIAMPAGRLDARSLRPLAEGRDVDWRDGIAAEHTTHSPYDFFPRRAWRDKRWKLIHNLMPGRENPSPAVDGCAAFAAAMKDTSPDGAHARAVHARHAHPPELELFDLEADPHEFTNLAGLPEHAGTERRLRAELLAWRERTSDPLLDPAALADLAARHDEIRERWLPVRDQGAEHWPKWEG
jgi:N-sulfoglucosamine sulfohydrolase